MSKKFSRPKSQPAVTRGIIESALPTGLTIDSDVWQLVFPLVVQSRLFTDGADFWSAYVAKECDIQVKGGNKLHGDHESLEWEMHHRLVQAAYAAGWVACSRQNEAIASNLSDIVGRIVVDILRTKGLRRTAQGARADRAA